MATTTTLCCTACHCDLKQYHLYGDDPYCDRCAPCPDCARPSRGLGRCAPCQASVVDSSAQALFLLPRVLGFLESQGILLHRVPGILVTDEIPAVCVAGFREEHRQAKSIRGLMLHEENLVWLRSGLPAATCAAALAHELTHAWQIENCPDQSRQLSEGLTCWVQRRMLLSLGYTQAANRMVMNEDHVYGDGLRLMLHLEDHVGTSNLLKKVRMLTDFPMWQRLTTLLGL